MKQGLSLHASQHLALTPQLQQSIRLLQLSTQELNHEIEQTLAENPFLELEEEAPDETASGVDAVAAQELSVAQQSQEPEEMLATHDLPDSAEQSWEQALRWDGEGTDDTCAQEGSADESDATGGMARTTGLSEDGADPLDWAHGSVSLTEHLQRQALRLRLSPPDAAALHYLMDSLSDDGYLEDSLESLAQGLAGSDTEQMQQTLHHLTVALALLQNLEPAGVGARSLAECLTLQLQALPPPAAGGPDERLRACALAVCAQPLELLARRDFKQLAQLTGCPETQVRAAQALIARLEPKPGRPFASVQRNYIVPDVLVQRIGRSTPVRYRVQINPDVMPRLRVHEPYANALKAHKSRQGENHLALQQRLQEARWFIKNIQQRFDTILRVSEAIVERQKNFFIHGELAMRPLVLREIADELGLHESTISRVTTAKYMATPMGTFELKYFFGSGLDTETGGYASSTAVRALIRQFVAAENPKKPLSDSQLERLLKEQGIACARRTVAKYRETLRIAPTHLRRAL